MCYIHIALLIYIKLAQARGYKILFVFYNNFSFPYDNRKKNYIFFETVPNQEQMNVSYYF